MGINIYKDAHNFCRNHGSPELDVVGGPWCFTNNEDVIWETCDIKMCNNRREMQYLVKYGYLSNQKSASYLMSDGKLDRLTREALLDFQSFTGINETGVFDKETLKMMTVPRCGVKDKLGDETQNNFSNR